MSTVFLASILAMPLSLLAALPAFASIESKAKSTRTNDEEA